MIQTHVISFKNAFSGLKWVIATQKNFKIHLFLSILSIIGGFIFQISYEEFLTIGVLIIIGLSIEIINTAIEEAIDAIHKDWKEEIKIAKDVSASAMLIFSLGSFLIASVIFIPRIIEFISFYL